MTAKLKNKMEPLKINIESLEKPKREEILKILSETGFMIVEDQEDHKFIKGSWYVHTESPGVLIRIDNPEKSICSGWTGAGRPFIYHYMFLSESRLRLATPMDVMFKVDTTHFDMNDKLTEKLNQELQPIRLGRKNQVAVLDDRNFGHEVLIFNKKYMHLAPAVVKFLNQIK